MKDRFSTSPRPVTARRVLVTLAALAVFLLAGSASAQGRTGPLVVLGLRAPDGDDAAAQNMTTALRSAARSVGFNVPNDSPALEQVMAMYSCDESLPPACLRQIAADQSHQRVVYGTVKRHGSGRNAPILIEVSYFDPTTDRENEGPPVEIAPAAASDNVQLNAAAHRIIDGLFPVAAEPVGPTASTGGANGGHGAGHGTNGQMVDTSPTPIRRYIGLGAAGVGVVLGVVAIVEGVMWFDFQNQQTAAGSPWVNYNAGGTFEQTCTQASSDTSAQGQDIQGICSRSTSLSATAWGLGAAGVVLIAAGAVLYLTDDTGHEHASRDPADGPRRARRTPVRVTGAPVISPNYQGATLQVSF